MKPPRGLTAEEAEAWEKVAQTVRPFKPSRQRPVDQPPAGESKSIPAPPAGTTTRAADPLRRPPPRQRTPGPPVGEANKPPPGLDSHWDRRFRAGSIEPDFTLDLHGHTLDSAHARLMDGLAQARALGARVVLLIAGKPRPVEHADRAERRGAIRAKVLDWLASSSHAPAIAAIRKAHQRHGGEGALYIVLRRAR